MIDKRIVFEDTEIIVVEKPAGVPVQSARMDIKDMVSILKNYLVDQNNGAKEPYLGLIHRLDQPVEGLLVFAKTKSAAQSLSQQVQRQEMVKKYLAVVHGIPNKKEMVLEDFLAKDGRTNVSKVVSSKDKNGKKSRLSYKVVQQIGDHALVEVTLFTGRHHQIRVQMANMGTPLLNDQKYGAEETGETSFQRNKPNIALCAYYLEFKHPKTKKTVNFQIEPKGESFKEFF